MATITSTNSYTLHGSGTVANSNVREDLANVIFNVTPFKTPFFSGIAKAKATNDNHEWLTDTLRDSADDNAAVEAVTRTAGVAGTLRTRKGNYIQIADEECTVTKKAEMLDKAGIPGKEMAYQLMKKGKELQTDIEKQMLTYDQNKVAPTASVAGVSAGVGSWILANQSVSATGGDDLDTSDGLDTVTPGTSEAISEPTFSTLLDGVWNNSGDLDNHCVMGNAAVVGKIRTLSGMSDDWQTPASGGTIYNRVTVYQSQFGPVKVMANKHMPANTAYIFDLSSWAIAFAGGKAFHTTDLATRTSAEQKLIESYYTLEARSEEANAAYYAITE